VRVSGRGVPCDGVFSPKCFPPCLPLALLLFQLLVLLGGSGLWGHDCFYFLAGLGIELRASHLPLEPHPSPFLF
jgi:hypothetical protein